MVFRHTRTGTTWVDLEKPTNEEIEQVVHEFGIGKRIETELLEPSPVPLAASDDGAILLVLHFPTHAETEEGAHDQEIDFVVGHDFIITVRYEVVPSLLALHKSFEAHELLGIDQHLTTDSLLEILTSNLFEAVRDHTKHVANRLTHIERDMFDGKERQTVHAISSINREFLHLEAALADDEDPLLHFLKALERRSFFGSEFAERAARIVSERDHVARLLSTHRAIATELQETNAALLNATQNEIMKTLTVISFIVLPLTLITGLFQMNIPGSPLKMTPDAFWIVISFMGITAGALTLFFARKRWL